MIYIGKPLVVSPRPPATSSSLLVFDFQMHIYEDLFITRTKEKVLRANLCSEIPKMLSKLKRYCPKKRILSK